MNTNEDEGDTIPFVEIYRGVGIHDRQPPERVERVVKPAIDFVLAVADAAVLVEYCADHGKPPEARLLAAAKIRAMHELAATDHRHRGVTAIDLEYVDACVTALDSQRWRSPYHYGSVLEPGPAPGEHRLERPREYRWR